jgi:hypothetical protein
MTLRFGDPLCKLTLLRWRVFFVEDGGRKTPVLRTRRYAETIGPLQPEEAAL